MPLISVIIPVYKVEKCLDKCVHSILSQTFTDFEAILVDDGGPDRSGEICDKWAREDNRIVVIHKGNGGVSSARNAGLDIAKGEYVLFVDGDDYIYSDYMEKLFSARADLTVCGLETRAQNGDLVRMTHPTERYFRAKIQIDIAGAYKELLLFSPYCKLFRRDIIEQGRIRFPLDVSWGEDGMFVADYLAQIQTMSVVEYAGYCYVKYAGEDSLSTKIRPNIIDTICRSREYCIDKVEKSAPWAYAETKRVCEEDIRRNCADFVVMLLNSAVISKREKCVLLKIFAENKYVQETFDQLEAFYGAEVGKSLKLKDPKRIVQSYYREQCRVKIREKMFMAYNSMPKCFKEIYRKAKGIVKHDS